MRSVLMVLIGVLMLATALVAGYGVGYGQGLGDGLRLGPTQLQQMERQIVTMLWTDGGMALEGKDALEGLLSDGWEVELVSPNRSGRFLSEQDIFLKRPKR